MGDIEFFDPDGANGWLANFSRHPIRVAGRIWPTVEHYFQAMKFTDAKVRIEVLKAKTPGEAKEIAESYAARKRRDWIKIRNLIMYNAIRAKFVQHPKLLRQLEKTGHRAIREISNDDSYWGSGNDRRGQNQMGRLLMRLRKNLVRGQR